MVFLESSGVDQRLHEGLATNVLELGFGLGLNFLLTADAAVSGNCTLSYSAYEKKLINQADFQQLNYQLYLRNKTLATTLSSVYACPPDYPGVYSYRVCARPECKLNLYYCDISMADFGHHKYDAVYLDAFSPESNPECWNLDIATKLHKCLKPGAPLVTYSVKSAFRHTLAEVGFEVEKRPGPPGKREILRAVAEMQ